MLYVRPIIALAACILAAPLTHAAPTILAPAKITVGRNLEAFTSVRLNEAAPDGGLEVKITSSDPKRLLLSVEPEQPGSESITVRVSARYLGTPPFCLHALADHGSVAYTVTAPGFGPAKGIVTLARSAIIMFGPSKLPTLTATPRVPMNITLYSAVLDASGKIESPQPIAGGSSANIRVTSSDPKVGTISEPAVTMAAGDGRASTVFQPAGLGTTTISIQPPPGFAVEPKFTTIKAVVDSPGIGLMGEVVVGKDLQISGDVLLGAPAPPEGLDVTLTSADPARLVLSARDDQLGSKSITLHIPPDKVRAHYFIQGLADSGIVNYTGSAPGYRTREARIGQAPSGIMVVFAPYGAPDEAEVLRPKDQHSPRPFTISLSQGKSAKLAVWSVYLDPATGRGADITAQRLRPGISPTVELVNSNPAVAKVASRVTMDGGVEFVMTDFTPLSVGETTISVNTPPGFTKPANATSVTAIVKK